MLGIPELTDYNVLLRGSKPSDIDDRFQCGRHHEFVHMCGGASLKVPEYPPRSVWERWYENQKNTPFSWVIDLGGRCIGTAGFHQLNEADKSARYRIGIFDPAYHGMGIGTAATKLLLKYGFETMHLHRIDLKVLEYNRRAIRCYEKCGFQQEGVLRESAYIDGKFYADILMGILDREFHE